MVKKRFNLGLLIACLVIVYLIAAIGSAFTGNSEQTEWYQSVKPSIAPSGAVIGSVWTVLFFLIALSMYFAWSSSKNKKKTFILYGLNLNLNMLWSYLFFGLRNTRAAFYLIIVLLVSIALLIYGNWKVDKKSSYLLIPYLLWTGFATILNYIIAF